MKYSRFELRTSKRECGLGQTARNYLDFVVDGKSIRDLIELGDFIGCLGWMSPEYDKQTIAQLFTKEEPEPESGRVPIYVCPECGDLGCGAVTARISESEGIYVWSDFAFENDYDGTVERYPDIGPFYFKKDEYNQVLNSYV